MFCDSCFETLQIQMHVVNDWMRVYPENLSLCNSLCLHHQHCLSCLSIPTDVGPIDATSKAANIALL